jgi:site-specific recombinase XerD
MKTTTPTFHTNYNRHPNGYVQLVMTCSDTRLFYSIGATISEKAWIAAKKKEGKFLNYLPADVKAQILEVESLVSEFTEGKTEVRAKALKNYLKEKQGKTEQPGERNHGFFEFVSGRLGEMRNGVLLNKGKTYSPSTIKNLESSLNTLKTFNPDLTLNDNGEEVLERFLSWSRKEGMGLSYSDRIIKDWKKFHRLCGKKLEFKRLDRKDIKTKKIYLSLPEIEALENADLPRLAREKEIPLMPSDEEIRDRYIINLFTALRISDMKELNETRVVGDNIYFESTQKTKEPVVIKMNSVIKRILNKRGGQFPRQYHEVTVNRRIKEIAKMVGITQKVEVKISQLPKFVKENLHELVEAGKIEILKDTVLIGKNELITNHTARRSAITNALRQGIPPTHIKGFTGLSFKTIEVYDKATPEDLAEDIGRFAMFQ